MILNIVISHLGKFIYGILLKEVVKRVGKGLIFYKVLKLIKKIGIIIPTQHLLTQCIKKIGSGFIGR